MAASQSWIDGFLRKAHNVAHPQNVVANKKRVRYIE